LNSPGLALDGFYGARLAWLTAGDYVDSVDSGVSPSGIAADS
jgi:hypothetical protein